MNPSGAFASDPSLAPHRGTLILVLGILSLVVCAPLGIPAWIMGHTDLREIREGRMDPAGQSPTNAGMICGIIGTLLFALSLVIGIITVLIAFLGVAGAAASG